MLDRVADLQFEAELSDLHERYVRVMRQRVEVLEARAVELERRTGLVDPEIAVRGFDTAHRLPRLRALLEMHARDARRSFLRAAEALGGVPAELSDRYQAALLSHAQSAVKTAGFWREVARRIADDPARDAGERQMTRELVDGPGGADLEMMLGPDGSGWRMVQLLLDFSRRAC